MRTEFRTSNMRNLQEQVQLRLHECFSCLEADLPGRRCKIETCSSSLTRPAPQRDSFARPRAAHAERTIQPITVCIRLCGPETLVSWNTRVLIARDENPSRMFPNGHSRWVPKSIAKTSNIKAISRPRISISWKFCLKPSFTQHLSRIDCFASPSWILFKTTWNLDGPRICSPHTTSQRP